MKKLFSKKKSTANRTPAWIVKAITRERNVRLRIAEIFRRQAARLTPNQLRWTFFAGLLVGCMAYTWIGVRAVSGQGKPPVVTNAAAPVIPDNRPVPRISFRRYIDSIRNDQALQKSFDSLRAVRPGFADTLRRLEQLDPGR
jgi:hypothetical protein